jgi:hypothetical protein
MTALEGGTPRTSTGNDSSHNDSGCRANSVSINTHLDQKTHTCREF